MAQQTKNVFDTEGPSSKTPNRKKLFVTINSLRPGDVYMHQ